ncbi:hypothetical protein [Synechococcus sp. CBW1107]|uniref:hypothetical protein n=1 Tax=Synechococcus sp. CBW1107 TaxID=2789857 RepID=UPI002AD53685|nr:hypothetical protein [Synechococcus sp. CBW1107]
MASSDPGLQRLRQDAGRVPLRLRIIRAVASSTAIETGQSIAVIEGQLAARRTPPNTPTRQHQPEQLLHRSVVQHSPGRDGGEMGIKGCAFVELFALKSLQKIGQEMGACKGKVPFAQVELAHLPCPWIDSLQPAPVPFDHFRDSETMRFSPVDYPLIELKQQILFQ